MYLDLIYIQNFGHLFITMDQTNHHLTRKIPKFKQKGPENDIITKHRPSHGVKRKWH